MRSLRCRLPPPAWQLCHATVGCRLSHSSAAEAPSAAAVTAAFRTLGVQRGAALKDVRKQYHKLAHQHHPDAGGKTADATPGAKHDAAKDMRDINDAWATAQAYFKSGGGAAEGYQQQHHQTSGNRRAASEGYHSYGMHGSPDGAAWGGATGDMPFDHTFSFEEMMNDPHMYAQFRQAMEEDRNMWEYEQHQAHRRHKPGDHKGRGRGTKGTHKTQGTQQQAPKGKDAGASKGKAAGDNAKQSHSRDGHVEFAEAEIEALELMYHDGKTFDFIANALGKPREAVIEAYNALRRASRRPPRGERGPKRHTHSFDHDDMDGFMYVEPDFDDYFGEGVPPGGPAGFYAPYDDGPDEGEDEEMAIPFYASYRPPHHNGRGGGKRGGSGSGSKAHNHRNRRFWR